MVPVAQTLAILGKQWPQIIQLTLFKYWDIPKGNDKVVKFSGMRYSEKKEQ